MKVTIKGKYAIRWKSRSVDGNDLPVERESSPAVKSYVHSIGKKPTSFKSSADRGGMLDSIFGSAVI